MKIHSLLLFAAALVGATSLAFSAKTTPADAASAEPVQLRIDVDRSVLPANTTDRAVIKISLDGLKPSRRELRPPVNLAIVIDRSGSMSGDKIEKAREAALEAVRQLAPDDLVALIAYDSQVETLVPAQRVGDRRRLEAAIRSIEATGNTALYGGVQRGAAELRRALEDRRYINRIILLSDGQANVGPSSPEELGKLGASLMREGISVSTVGLGLGFNEDLMTRLAQRSDGNTYFVEDSADLPSIFAAELGDVLSVVARRVVIEVEFPEGVRPLNFIGREGSIKGQSANCTLSQLYGGQSKFALIEVEVAPAATGTRRELAKAKVHFENPMDQRTIRLSATRAIEFSASQSVVVASADHEVQADYASNVLAAVKDEAVGLVDSNRRDAAGTLLRTRAAELAKIAKTYSNPAVERIAAPAAVEADRLERDGLGVSERKAYRAESVQTKNQQKAP